MTMHLVPSHAFVRRPGGLLLLCLVIGLLSLGPALPAQAAEIDVPCDVGELINALNTANSNTEADTLNLAAGCMYALTVVDNTIDGANGLPSITSEIIIQGNGATIERDSAAPDFRILHVAAGGDITLNGLTVSNGDTLPDDTGGGIFNNGGTVTLTNNSGVSGNTATDAGGIFNNGGLVTLTNSVVSGNSTNGRPGLGGGILNQNGGTVSLVNSSIGDNSAIQGGGIFNDDNGTVALTESTVSHNTAFDKGGGIRNDAGTVELVNSTVSDNIADFGAGIGTEMGSVTLTDNSVVGGNSASRDGGGIDNLNGLVTLADSVISGNSASFGGGVLNTGGTLILTDSVIADNQANGGGGIFNIADSGGTATVTLTDSTLNGNAAVGGNGGGIFNVAIDGMAAVKLSGSTVNGNSAITLGGGIRNDAGTVELINSTVGDNIANFGAGIGTKKGLVTLTDDSTISGNSAAFTGGGLFSSTNGTVDVVDSTIDNNSANVSGGGVANFNSLLTLTGSSIVSNNSATLGGGGLLNDNGGTMDLTQATIVSNSARDGGGVYNSEGTVTLIASNLVSGNSATLGGGGIFNDTEGTLNLTNSTISDNSAGDDGGGINNFGTAALVSSTVSGNSAVDGGGLFNNGLLNLANSTISGNSATLGAGGGIFNSFGQTNLVNNTISQNSAVQGGGGLLNGSGTVDATNTIVADQLLGGDCSGAVTSGGHNLDSDGSCALSAPGDLTAPPLLGPLQDNGGPTGTHALLPGSPAVDAAEAATCAAAPVKNVDQRGQPRPLDGDGDGLDVCDIGAFELPSPTAITLVSFTAKTDGNRVTLTWVTASELDNEGFNLWRSEVADGPYSQINPSLIPAQGNADTGANYEYLDANVVKGNTYYYKLEDVDIHGVSAFHGPVSATVSSIQRIYLPFIWKN